MKRLSWILAAALAFCAVPFFDADAQESAPAAAPSAAPVQDDASVAMDPSKVLPKSVEDRLKAIRNDPDPDQLVRDAHYWVSNENAQYVWYKHIKDMGGVLTGVGTDQVYLFAGWANSSIIIPMDFDRQIRNLHVAYGAAFMASENISEFRTYWKKDAADKMKAALEKYFPDEADIAMKAWNGGYREVNSRFNRVIKKYTKCSDESGVCPAVGIPTFLTDEAQYARIRQLWINHRVVPLCGDLTGSRTMLDIAKALKDSKLALTIMYPSNAEHYFKYGPEFRRNIINMPFTDNGVILRTRQMKFHGLAEENDYHYNIQSAKNFKMWLETTRISDQHNMLRKKTKTKTTGLSILDYEPTPSKKAPEIAPMP